MDKKQKWTIKFLINSNRYRRKTMKKPPKPIKRSKWAQYLWDVGAGWSDE